MSPDSFHHATIRELLGESGPVAALLPGFAPREVQQIMAELVEQACKEQATLVVEAGTGTGKTFAYLVAALLSDQKVILSTGTKNLQDQLYFRDLPLMRDALRSSKVTALLKGRSNYLCLHRLDLTASEPTGSRTQMAELHKIQRWSKRTRSGDVAEVAEVPEKSPIWFRVTSNSDNCLGQDCPDYQKCFLVQARAQAQAADLVVINHHLLFSDLSLKERGFGELLPQAGLYVLDEAHQIPQLAAQFFGSSITGRQLLDLAKDTSKEIAESCADAPNVRDQLLQLEKSLQQFRESLGEKSQKAPWAIKRKQREVMEQGLGLVQGLQQLSIALEPLEEYKNLQRCRERCLSLTDQLRQLLDAKVEDSLYWFETFAYGFALHRTPMDISKEFQAAISAHAASWIFTSATLSVKGSFAHFNESLGMENPRTSLLESPFDFAKQALFYLPQQFPLPSDHDFVDCYEKLVLELLTASHGRAFLLFTSHAMLEEMARRLSGKVPWPLLIQGQAPKGELTEQFQKLGNAVLLGTSSFWEGVDVRGAALSCVVIDKLPFAAPNDPILQARVEGLKKKGQNAFLDYQVPEAVISLKQGAGRLIRDVTDRGVFVLCDQRLLKKAYGQYFLDSLPPMARTRELQDVVAFFQEEMKPQVELL